MHIISGVVFLTTAVVTVLVVLLRILFGINFIGYYEFVGILSGIAIVCSLVVAELNSSHIKIDISPFEDYSFLVLGRWFLLVLIYISLAAGQFWAAYESFNRSYRTIMLDAPIYVLYTISGCFFVILTLISLRKIARHLASEGN